MPSVCLDSHLYSGASPDPNGLCNVTIMHVLSVLDGYVDTLVLMHVSQYVFMYLYIVIHVHVLMREMRRKEERSKQGQTNNKAKQHSTPKAVTCTCTYMLRCSSGRAPTLSTGDCRLSPV